jgi:hypothetical protein
MDKKRIKLSGHQFRLKRRKEMLLKQKQSESMLGFLTSRSHTSDNTQSVSIRSETNDETDQMVEEKIDEIEKIQTDDEADKKVQDTEEIDESKNDKNKTIDSEEEMKSDDDNKHANPVATTSKFDPDPGTWNRNNIGHGTRQMLVEKGPLEIKNRDFPRNSQGRCFTEALYTKLLKNGDQVTRPWLLYSIQNDSVYCFCCFLFGDQSITWKKEGYSDWKNVHRYLEQYEKSAGHMKAFVKWRELDQKLKCGKTIDAVQQAQQNIQIKFWRNIIKRIIAVVQMLTSQNLAFRGSSDRLFEKNNGNFLKCIEMLSKFDPILEEHLRKVQLQRDCKKWSVSYLSKTIQDELIEQMTENVKQKIIALIKDAKYYSVIMDCTPDISRVEQLSLIIRIVCLDPKTNEFIPEEFFIGFFPVTDSSGAGLTELLMEKLKVLGLNVQYIRGQGYDNGANMKGIRSGVQRRLLLENPRAFFVPCGCHSLNLVLNDAASESGQLVGFFSTVQELFTFFSASTARWNVLKNHITHITLKPLSTTRWSSRIDALTPLRYQMGEIYDALVEIRTTFKDAEAKAKAEGLARSMKKFQFICSVFIWYEVLFKVDKVSKTMQSPKIDIT